MSTADWNGFKVCGYILPDIVLENLLASVPIRQILELRQVCRVWRDIILRRSFWKIVCERNGIDWTSIPDRIKEHDQSWIVFYVACAHRIFRRNFVLNHSGHQQFDHWDRIQDTPAKIIVESPPICIEPLPNDPKYFGEPPSAFVYPNDWSVLQQKVLLKEVGLTKEVMRTIMPFQFVATQILGTRWDSGGRFCVVLCLLDRRGEALSYTMHDCFIPACTNWSEYTHTLNVVEEFDRFDDVESFSILLIGRDSDYISGNYGTKCTRVAVNLKCLSPMEAESVAPHQKYITNMDNGHIFMGNFWRTLLPNRRVGRCPYSRPNAF